MIHKSNEYFSSKNVCRFLDKTEKSNKLIKISRSYMLGTTELFVSDTTFLKNIDEFKKTIEENPTEHKCYLEDVSSDTNVQVLGTGAAGRVIKLCFDEDKICKSLAIKEVVYNTMEDMLFFWNEVLAQHTASIYDVAPKIYAAWVCVKNPYISGYSFKGYILMEIVQPSEFNMKGVMTCLNGLNTAKIMHNDLHAQNFMGNKILDFGRATMYMRTGKIYDRYKHFIKYITAFDTFNTKRDKYTFAYLLFSVNIRIIDDDELDEFIDASYIGGNKEYIQKWFRGMPLMEQHTFTKLYTSYPVLE